MRGKCYSQGRGQAAFHTSSKEGAAGNPHGGRGWGGTSNSSVSSFSGKSLGKYAAAGGREDRTGQRAGWTRWGSGQQTEQGSAEKAGQTGRGNRQDG